MMRWCLSILFFLLVTLWWLSRPGSLPDLADSNAAPTEGELRRGEYLINVAGCVSCHTDAGNGGAYLAGGLKLDTPFGSFFAPNITADEETGIGLWSFRDFAKAMHLGISPAGERYYPAFPYTSYTQINSSDLRAMYAYLQTTTPAKQRNERHDTPWYINRFALRGWQTIFFKPGVFQPAAGKDETWNRGAYIVHALTHCSECHTPRNAFGASRPELFLGGVGEGPDGDPVPNVTPSKSHGIGDWDEDELLLYLEEGELPDGDYAGGAMVDVIENSTSALTPTDLQAVAEYLFTVPALDSN